MKKLFVVHPFLFAIFPVLSLFAHNKDQLSLNVVFIPSAVAIGFALLSWSLLSFIFKDKKKAGLCTSFFLLIFFSYGHFFNPIQGLAVGGFEIGRHRYFFPVWVLCFMCGAYFIVKIRKNLRNLTFALNIAAAFLVIISAINIGVYEFKRRVIPLDNKSRKNVIEAITDSGEPDMFPDIYYIIFDRYASSGTLKEYYDYDNSEFTNYLNDKGFYVVSESRCNYPSSYLSLASSLNMKYLNYLTNKLGEESTDKTVVYEMLQDYKVWRFLKSKGYKFVHFGSWWGPTQKNRYADMNVYSDVLSDFSRMLLYRTTIARVVFDKFLSHGYHRKRVLEKFDKLAEMPNIKEPKFVFAHMIIPHPPFVFGQNGEPLARKKIGKRSKKENYLNQLIFVNKKIKLLVDEILSKSKVPPIIILQADEGPSLSKSYLSKSEKIDELKGFKIRIRIFNAYYLPGTDKNVLYKSITPVNSFRLIFNLYFGTNLELLKDKSYISEGGPYKFIDVTDKVKYD